MHMQELWGGMGAILQLTAHFPSAPTRQSFIAKVIDLPTSPKNTSERRKKASYLVEARFYERGYAEQLCLAGARCPLPLLVDWPDGEDPGGSDGDGHSGQLTICMTQIRGCDSRGLSDAEMLAALGWLARLHATFWAAKADEAVEGGLHPQGCYWHLDTRLEELERWTDTEGFEGRLRLAARAIDARLKADRHQTICHGDAKSENMLFDDDGSVSMYDFQYIGKASPGKDLAYCLICTSRGLSAAQQVAYLRHYLAELGPLLEAQGEVAPTLEELQVIYGLSVCDLARWMVGWNRQYWGSFRRMLVPRCAPVLDAIDGGQALPTEAAYLEAVLRTFPL